MIFIRCCGRFCSALAGTFFAIESEVAGPHELSQGTMFCCGLKKTWSSGKNNAGVYVGRNIVPFFNHFNISHNVLYPYGTLESHEDMYISSARGVAIYGMNSGAGFNCSFLTAVNNSGHAIIDCGMDTADGRQAQPPVFNFANIVQNHATTGFGSVYATILGYVLSDCVFLGNSGGSDLYCSENKADHFRKNFKLTNCFFSRPLTSGIYDIVNGVVTQTTTATYAIGHLHNEGCPAALQYASNTFKATSFYSGTRRLTETNRLVPTQATGHSDRAVTAGMDLSQKCGRTNSNGGSLFFAVTDLTVRPSHRMDDSQCSETQEIGESGILVGTQYIESAILVQTLSIAYYVARVLRSSLSVGSLDPSDPTELTLLSMASPSAILAMEQTQYTESEEFGMTDSSRRSFFFDVTDLLLGPTHRMDDSHCGETERISE
jgi:hypothetical protein